LIFESHLKSCYQWRNLHRRLPIARKSKLNIRRLVSQFVLRKNLDRLKEQLEVWDCTTCKTCSIRCRWV